MFYQELIALYGTFAIPEKQGLIIDKLRLGNLDMSLRSMRAMRRNPATGGTYSELLMLAKKYRRNANGR